MNTFQIDTEKKTIHLSLLLQGETEPVDVNATYRLVEKDGKHVIEISEAHFSREWLSRLFDDFVPNERKAIELPTAMAKAAALTGF